jgi:hypothetical protein
LFPISVKYIKEMSAFFKNTLPGAPLPWDSPHATPQKGADAPPTELKEARTIPLKMCQVTRKQCPPDTENRYCGWNPVQWGTELHDQRESETEREEKKRERAGDGRRGGRRDRERETDGEREKLGTIACILNSVRCS